MRTGSVWNFTRLKEAHELGGQKNSKARDLIDKYERKGVNLGKFMDISWIVMALLNYTSGE